MAETDFLQPSGQRDFALLVEGQKVYVNRSYLAYWSPVFAKIFFPEGAPFEQPEGAMEMKEKKLADFLTFLNAVFPTDKTMLVNESNVATLVAYADEYDVVALRERCVKLMGDQLKDEKAADETLIDWLRLASLYNLKDLQNQLVLLIAKLSFDKLEAAQKMLPLGALAAVFYYKARLATADVGVSMPGWPEGAFRCTGCSSKTCSISNGASSCCNMRVVILATAAAQIEVQCSFTCEKCRNPCSLKNSGYPSYQHSSCCSRGVFVNPKCGMCKKRLADVAAAVVGPARKATDFSAELLDRDK